MSSFLSIYYFFFFWTFFWFFIIFHYFWHLIWLFLCFGHHLFSINQEAARASLTLLRNVDQTLPLQTPASPLKVGLVGFHSNNAGILSGNYAGSANTGNWGKSILQTLGRSLSVCLTFHTYMRFFYSDNTHGFYLYVLCCLFYCIYCRWKRKSSSHASERMLHYSMSRIYKQYQYRFSRCAENCGGVWSRGRHSWLSLWWVLFVSTWTSCGKIFLFHATLPFYLQWIIQN